MQFVVLHSDVQVHVGWYYCCTTAASDSAAAAVRTAVLCRAATAVLLLQSDARSMGRAAAVMNKLKRHVSGFQRDSSVLLVPYS